ncbi:MAG: hypothetical protein KC729_21525, partial [Candidatus Eisenbacteria bacterium]|nr:hypothetical protein [Candidatus Eisenbacteria bacterium]
VIPVHASGLTITHSPYCFGDFDGSGDVTAFDLSQIIPRWRCCVGDGCYDPRFDVNVLERGGYCASSPDGCTDVVDIQTVAGRWHHGCPGTAPAEDAAAFELAPSVSVSPAQADVVAEVGDTTSVALIVTDVTDLGAFQIGLSFDPGVVTVESVHTGALLGSTGRTVYNLSTQIDNGTGVVHFGACTIDNGPAAAGSGVLARVVFRVEDCEGVTDLALSDVILTYADGWPQALGGSADGTMSIHCASTDVPVATDAITFALEPNRPNPLSSSTTITFSLPSGTGGEPTRLAIFDAGGRLIRTLVDGVLDPGRHRVEWDSRDASGTPVPSGTYFCRLTLGGTSLNRPLQLIR